MSQGVNIPCSRLLHHRLATNDAGSLPQRTQSSQILVGVYQTLASPLTAGQYTLEFWSIPWHNDTGNDVRVGDYSGSGSLDVVGSWTSLALDVVNVPTVNAGVWELQSYTFTAIGGEDTVYFGTANVGSAHDGADIDDVSLTPEPASLILLGLGGLGVLSRRKRRA